MIKSTELRRAHKLIARIQALDEAVTQLESHTPDQIKIVIQDAEDEWCLYFDQYNLSINPFIEPLAKMRDNLIRELRELGVEYDPSPEVK